MLSVKGPLAGIYIGKQRIAEFLKNNPLTVPSSDSSRSKDVHPSPDITGIAGLSYCITENCSQKYIIKRLFPDQLNKMAHVFQHFLIAPCERIQGAF